MSDIPTHEVVTPQSKAKVVIKDWVTGADDDAIQGHYYGSAQSTDQQGNTKVDGKSAVLGAENEGLARAIVSVNGVTTGIAEAVKAMPLLDTRFVLAEVKKVLNPKVEDLPRSVV